jgi:hypothetical protein
MITTAKKIVILCFEDARALLRTSASPTYRDNFKSLKTLRIRMDLITNKEWAPVINIPKKTGKMAKRSTIPKKLKIYLAGFSIEIIRRIYSIVKNPVNTHSRIKNALPY